MVGSCIELYRISILTNALRLVSLAGDGVIAPIAIVVLAASLVLIFKKDRVFAIILLLTPLLGNVVKDFLKNFFAVPRPEAFGCDVLVAYGDIYSLPSGHTIFYTIFFGLLAYYSIKNWKDLWAKFVLPLSILMILSIGYSRIYLGAHWYLDILAGYIVGGAILAIVIMIYEYCKHDKKNDDRVFDNKGNVRAAGAIVFQKTGKTREYLLVFRRKQNDYSFPKGRIEKGESAETAAKREILEETGYKIKISKDLKPITYNYPEGGGVVVEMFEATVSGQGKKIETNEMELWVEEKNVIDLLSYPNLKTFFKAYLENKDNA